MLSNCKDCGKLFQKTIGDVCSACIKARNEAIQKIDSYAFKHKELSIEKISENTGLDDITIRKLIAEGKVNSIKSLKEKCEMCGKEAIVSTTTFLCKDCVSDIKSVQTTKKDAGPIIKRQGPTSGMRSRSTE